MGLSDRMKLINRIYLKIYLVSHQSDYSIISEAKQTHTVYLSEKNTVTGNKNTLSEKDSLGDGIEVVFGKGSRPSFLV